MFALLGPSLLLTVPLCIHVVRTNQAMYWLWILLAFPWIGGLIYLAAIVVPSLTGGVAARRLASSARDTLDPTREYRAAREAVDLTPTVQNQMRMARAATGLGRHDEAERLYRAAASGIHAEDPVLLLGLAQSLLELGRAAEALEVTRKVAADPEQARNPHVPLALARAHEALGDTAAADADYRSAVERLPGLEALGRYAAFLARSGRNAEAAAIIADLDQRIARASPPFRREGRQWRDLAQRALAGR